MVKSILEDYTHCIGLGGLGDQQIRNPVKKSKKVSKGPLRILTGLEVGCWRTSHMNCTQE
jgi:hypothetical protein